VIAGEVTRVGTRYLLVARILDPATGSDLVSFREEGAGDDDLLPAIDRLSSRLREKMGESLRTIRLGTPLEQATTSSLEALRKLTEAERAEEAGRYEVSLRLLNEAVALDSAFAQAHRKIAVLLLNTGADEAAIEEASTLAYRYRDRLTDRERYLAEANYHSNVTGDDDAVIRAYEAALAVSPDESAALNNLSNVFRKRARFEDARRLLERAVAGPGASSVASSNLVRVRLALDDLAGAREAARAYRDRYAGHIFIPWIDLILAAATNDAEAVHTLANATESDPLLTLLHPQLPVVRIAADAYEGSMAEALDHSASIEDFRLPVFQQVLSAPLGAPDIFLWLLDDSASAVEAVPDVLEQVGFDEWSHERPEWRFPIVTLALAGDPDAAAALYDRWVEGADQTEFPAGSAAIARAMIQLAQGMHEEALATVEQAASELRCERCVEQETALIYEASGRVSDAIAIWERVRAAPLDQEAAGWDRIVATRRLGPLYEASADTAGALGAYEALVDAWTDADPELQPQVDVARERIAALGG
jgi:tetratricopeptide (TPR) repeat protein